MLLRASSAVTVNLPSPLAPRLAKRAVSTIGSLKRRSAIKSTLNQTTFDNLRSRLTSVDSNGTKSSPSVDIFNSTVLRIRQALRSHDVGVVWEYWQYLERERLLRFLGYTQLKQISSLLAESFCPSVGQPWVCEQRIAVEEIALFAAAARTSDALNTIMLAHIRRNDPSSVLSLYQRFLTIVGRKDSYEDTEYLVGETGEEVRVDYDALASVTFSSNNVDSIPYGTGRAAILLAAIAAHAMQDSFSGALHACLDTNVRLHHYATTVFLQKLAHNPPLRDKVDAYVNRLRVATMVARPADLSKRVTHLASNHATKSLERLYRAIVDEISGQAPSITTEESLMTSSRPVLFSEISWAAFLAAFLKCGQKDLATKLWDDMIDLGVRPGVSTWTAYIDACDGVSAFADAIDGWDMMLESGVQPGPLTYRALMSVHFNMRSVDKAMEVFQSFQQTLNSTPEALVVYNTVLHGLLLNGRLDDANQLLAKMHKNGPSPDVISYNTFLKYWSRMGNFRMLASLVNEMSSAGLVGDVFSFSTILTALLKVGREDAPDLMITLMRKQGVEPNVAIYSAIIDQQLREQNEQSLRSAMRLLQRMELDPRSQPNEVTYTSFLAGIYRGNWLPPTVAEDWRQNIIERMQKRGIKPNRVTYHLLLKACLEYDEPAGLHNALTYYRDMVQQKIPLVHVTWYILLSGLIQRGEWLVAGEIMKDMFQSGFQPTGSLLELAGKIRKRQAISVP